jgi:hypothetical protein
VECTAKLYSYLLHRRNVNIRKSISPPPPPTGWTIGVLGFDSRRGLGIFLFTTASRTALGPTQPPVQWVKRLGCEADLSPPSSAEVKACVELYLYSPNMPFWRGAYVSTGTTLPFSYLCHGNKSALTMYYDSCMFVTEKITFMLITVNIGLPEVRIM